MTPNSNPNPLILLGTDGGASSPVPSFARADHRLREEHTFELPDPDPNSNPTLTLTPILLARKHLPLSKGDGQEGHPVADLLWPHFHRKCL